MKFLGQGFHVLEHEQARQTHRCNRMDNNDDNFHRQPNQFYSSMNIMQNEQTVIFSLNGDKI